MMNDLFTVRGYLIFSILIFNTACSPPSSDPTQVEMSDLIGLWDSSENKLGKTDVIYTRITSDGAIMEYDFDGDEVDNGLPCYQIDTGSLKNIEANRFMVSVDMHAKKRFEVELELLDAGHALKIYFLDAEEPAKTLKSQIWTRVSDESLLDNEPSCRKK